MISEPLKIRFGIQFRLITILMKKWANRCHARKILNIQIDPDAALEIKAQSKDSRIANPFVQANSRLCGSSKQRSNNTRCFDSSLKN